MRNTQYFTAGQAAKEAGVSKTTISKGDSASEARTVLLESFWIFGLPRKLEGLLRALRRPWSVLKGLG